MHSRRSRVVATVVALVIVGLMVATPLPNYLSRAMSQGERGLVAILPSFMDTFTGATGLGALPDTPLTVGVSLSPPSPGAADAYVYAMNAPGSPYYHHYLTPTEWRAVFSPSMATYQAVQDYYRGYGLRTISSPDRLMIGIEGPSDQIAQAFHTSFGNYRLSSSQVVYGPTTSVYIPEGLHINAVTGMTDAVGPRPHGLIHPETARMSYPHAGPQVGSMPHAWSCTSGTQQCDEPGYYNEYPLFNKGYTGTGIKVGIVDAYDSGFTQSQLASSLSSWASSGGLPAPKENFLYPIPASGNLNASASSGWGGETDLDQHMVDMTAPGSTIDVAFASDQSFAVYETVDYLVANNVTQTISMSWGEADVGTMYAQPQNPCLPYYSCNASWDGSYAFLHPVFAEAVAEGITPFAASGDCGAADGTAGVATDYPASDPFVVGVGGTIPNGTGSVYAGETGWSGNGSKCLSNTGGGGGGWAPWHQPWWQHGPGNLTNGLRGVPDVSTDSSGGTSQAAPMWAGWAAVADQIHGSGLGLIGPSIYAILRNSTAYAADFHDIVVGNNGYPAGPGWDPVTGIGSPNTTALLPAISGYRPESNGNFTVSLKVSPTAGTPPLKATLTAQVTGGKAPYSYDFVPGLYMGEWTTASSIGYTYTRAGMYEAMVTVFDGNGNSVTSQPVLVNPGGAAISATLAASATSATVGTPVTFTATAAGGKSPYQYTYYYGDNTYGYNGTTTNTHLYHSPGTFCPSVFVSDSAASPGGGYANTTCIVVVPGAASLSIVSFSASPSTVNVGSTTYMNVSAVGGSTPYTYAYSGLPPGCATSNVASLSCSPTSTGSFNPMVKVTDSKGATASKTTTLVVTTASTSPTISSFTASPDPVTVNTATTFSATVSGGTTPYTFAYTGLPAGCASSNTNSISCTPTATGTFNVTVTVTDANSKTASKSTTLTVNSVSVPTVTAFSASPDPITVNTATTFSATVSGGTTPYTYAYTGLPAGCASSNTNSLSCTPTATGTFNVTVTVTDANSKTASKSTTVTVNSVSVPTITAFSASPDPITVNTVTTFSATVTGGTTPYTYSYTGLPTGCTTYNTNSLSCTPTATGTFSVAVTVTDANSVTATRSTSLTVNPASVPTITSFSASANPVTVNTPTVLSVAVSGGKTPYAYAYTGLPSGCTSANTNSLTCTPTVIGSFTIVVTVTDANGNSASNTLTLTVNSASVPTITSFSASPDPVAVNTLTTFSVAISGGTSPYTFAYTGLPPGCSSSNTNTLSCTPTAVGSFSVTVTATDAKGQTASRITSLTVNSASVPTITSFAASMNPVPANATTVLTVTVSGGKTPYAYSYTGLPTGCTSSNTVSLSCTPTAPGTFSVTVTVTDANGQAASKALTLIVNSASVPTITSFAATPNPVAVNTVTLFSVAVSGGTKPYGYAYTGLPTGCSSSNANSLSCTPTAAGTYPVSVTVTDASGNTATKTLTLTVNSSSTSFTITSFSATPNPVHVNGTTLLTVTASGGTAPYSYAYSGLPAGCLTSNTSSLSCTPSEAGTFNVVVKVTDSLGRIANKNTALVVESASSPTNIWGLTTTEWLLVAIAAVVAATAIGAILIGRRKRGRIGKSPVAPEWDEGSTANPPTSGAPGGGYQLPPPPPPPS